MLGPEMAQRTPVTNNWGTARNLALAGICGVVVIFGSACGAVSRSETGGAHLTPQPSPPLTYCELASHPDKYDGQTVRVAATLYFMMHGYKFMDKDCAGDDKETAVLLTSEQESKLARETGSDEYNPWSFPTIIATGKFSRVTPSRKSDSVADNSNLIFETEVVERIIK
jgi:hypothetical protein